MRKIIFFIVLSFLFSHNAQAQKQRPRPKPILNRPNIKNMPTDYIAEWREIDSLADNSLPKSANEKTLLLYAKAKAENNAPQIIKTLLYCARFVMQLEEKEGFVPAINLWQEQIKTEAFPIKPVMQSLLADMYYKYFSRNQYKILQRTATVNFKNDDFETWSAERFIDTSAALYRASLSDERTKTIKTETFKDIIDEGVEFKLRPTLFDVLAQSALNFFNDDKNYLPRNAQGFVFDKINYFFPAELFAKLPLNATENSEHKLWTLRLYQQLTEFHLGDAEKTAMTQIDLDRYKYLREQAVIETKDSLYQQRLEELLKIMERDSNSVIVANALAEFHTEQANYYKPNPKDLYRFKRLKARDILTGALKNFPTAYGAASARMSLKNLEAAALNVTTEHVYLPEESLLARFNFTNVKEVFMRIIKVPTQYNFNNDEKYTESLRKSAYLKQWSVMLPVETDLNEHTAEFKIDKLPVGQYVLLATTNDKFTKATGSVTCATRFQVSNLAYFAKNNEELTEFVVMHRKTGEPLANVAAEFYENVYQNGVYKNKKIGNRASDANGFVTPTVKSNANFSVIFSKGNDTLVGEQNYYRYNYDGARNQISTTTHFFTDRSLYRPGQTVFYKALVFTKNSNPYVQSSPKIFTNGSVTITLFDANNQKVSEQTATTNSFGTINGSFVLPSSGLTGNFYLQSSEHGSQNIKVEEYKRPKFEVTLAPLRGTYVLNEKINLEGKAIAYTGANLDGAKVQFRVQRNVILPYEFNWYYGFRRNASVEIAHGDVATDAQGNFMIPFTALPDLQFPSTVKPTFTYSVSVDVTDINGETHSAQTQVKVAYTAVVIEENLTGKIELKKLSDTIIKVTNVNGEAVETPVNYKIELLAPPSREYIARYWTLPDTFLMSEAAFKKDFPQYAFRNEDQIAHWMVNKIVTAQTITSQQKLSLPKLLTQAGVYRFTYSVVDKSGETITRVQHLEVIETSSNAKTPETLALHLEKSAIEPTETLKLNLNTRSGTFYALIQEDFDAKIQNSVWKKFSGSENYTRLMEEKHRGGFALNVLGVRNNREYAQIYYINVPFTNKELNVRYETFRDKLEPGANEEWRMIIAGNKKEHVAAEMVAALYDASLDAIYKHDWSLYLYNQRTSRANFEKQLFNAVSGEVFYEDNNTIDATDPMRTAPNFNNFGLYNASEPIMYRTMAMSAAPMEDRVVLEKVTSGRARKEIELPQIMYVPPKVIESENQSKQPENQTAPQPVKLRTNLNETVFFFPTLNTDSLGNVVVKFTMGEALTRWRFLAFAHTADLQTVLSEKTIVTQKDVMVVPNVPRFLREGDKIVLAAKINNLSGKNLTAVPSLVIKNPLNNEDVSSNFKIESQTAQLELQNGASGVAKWSISVPNNFTLPVALQYSVTAGNFSDGEENVVPVLTNRELITETLPMALRSEQTKTFNFDALEKAKTSKTLTHQSLSLEFTKNPVWYAVQALPYIMEYPHECAEQIFSRYYANSIASHVVKTMPQINAVFKQWAAYEPNALKSNLNKNAALKSALLEETPWVINAQNEELQKKNIALLFDLNKMADEQANALKKLRERQNADGGISWFSGDRSNWFITQYILSGLGHLKNLNVTDATTNAAMRDFKTRGFQFCAKEVETYYADIEKNVHKKYTTWEDDHLNSNVVQYFYALSFNGKEALKSDLPTKISDYFLGQLKKYWTKRLIYEQTMFGLIALRRGDNTTAQAILKSLKERAIQNAELGMYWKNPWSYFWYEQPVETQSLLIEFFDAMNQKNDVEEMKIWLIKNKQTTAWRTTKATSEAIYALLKTGTTDLAVESKNPTIEIGGTPLNLDNMKMETGTGYFKTDIAVADITKQPSSIKITNPNKNIAWGAMYWQYFENFENIKDFNATPLKLKRGIFKQTVTDKGVQLLALSNEVTNAQSAQLVQGDKIIVRIELEVDRPMEFLHLKDYRAAGLEPVNVLSSYKYSGGLGYYESTRDVATNFFISSIQPGKYVFEYPLVVNLSGVMSNGVAKIQSMYAPEFSAHSAGSVIEIK